MAFHEFTNGWTPLPRITACLERPARRRPDIELPTSPGYAIKASVSKPAAAG
jgi:hypothetical protein